MLLLASLCHSGLPGIFPGFSEGFPPRFACGNDTPSMRLHNTSHFADTTLVLNRGKGELLLREQRQFDFFLRLKDPGRIPGSTPNIPDERLPEVVRF